MIFATMRAVAHPCTSLDMGTFLNHVTSTGVCLDPSHARPSVGAAFGRGAALTLSKVQSVFLTIYRRVAEGVRKFRETASFTLVGGL